MRTKRMEFIFWAGKTFQEQSLSEQAQRNKQRLLRADRKEQLTQGVMEMLQEYFPIFRFKCIFKLQSFCSFLIKKQPHALKIVTGSRT